MAVKMSVALRITPPEESLTISYRRRALVASARQPRLHRRRARVMSRCNVLGARAAMLGTRFVTSTESRTHSGSKEVLLAASAQDTALTGCFDGGWPYAVHRVLPDIRELGSSRLPAIRPSNWRRGYRSEIEHRLSG